MDPEAAATLRPVSIEEQEHHDLSLGRMIENSLWSRLLAPIVSAFTEAVIWLGMRLWPPLS